ncbi:MAG: VTT domain-containing protein [Candidatus Sungiibacteriota bacterium]|uniref:VTT domain-containing protein n=1 Tax=Candidatus Sungiibacteriota bacterium TaxID=2750080 RepID=A0A7T5RL80_9BACT|nr:MAG: VTT domain-containing protein [Candidatus Sungbacteria bacterium]
MGFDLALLIRTVGYLGLFGIVFAESGLLLGFFLPGDSLLFTAGLLASQGFLNIFTLIIICFAGAVLGDSFGYAFGKKVGPKIFVKEESFLFRRAHLERARRFYERYGGAAIILARFMPLVRTFAPILAGVGEMRYRTFLFYNIIGGFFWAVGLTLLGFYLGSVMPEVDRYLLPIIGFIVFLSVLPAIIHLVRGERPTL